MEAKVYLIMISLVFALVLAACNKDDSETEKGATRSAAVNDSIVNDSTSGGITVTINDEWAGDTVFTFDLCHVDIAEKCRICFPMSKFRI